MNKLYCLGELLIDFQSVGYGSLKDTKQFVKNAGGAPANVCVQAVKLGRDAAYLTQVGADAFGDFLVETLKAEGVDTSFVLKSADYDTSLAFVSFQPDGERQFSFYRRSAADLHFTAEDFEKVNFEKGDVLEFGSVALATKTAVDAHISLIERAKKAGATICFDPNLRLNLWEENALRSTVKQFLPLADVVKMGKDEAEFVFEKSADEAVRDIFTGNVKILLLTDGGAGARLYTKEGLQYVQKGFKVNTVDTTGAGDSFFGGFIAGFMDAGCDYEGAELEGILEFACKCGAYTTTNYGAIPAMGTREIIDKAVK